MHEIILHEQTQFLHVTYHPVWLEKERGGEKQHLPISSDASHHKERARCLLHGPDLHPAVWIHTFMTRVSPVLTDANKHKCHTNELLCIKFIC